METAITIFVDNESLKLNFSASTSRKFQARSMCRQNERHRGSSRLYFRGSRPSDVDIFVIIDYLPDGYRPRGVQLLHSGHLSFK